MTYRLYVELIVVQQKHSLMWTVRVICLLFWWFQRVHEYKICFLCFGICLWVNKTLTFSWPAWGCCVPQTSTSAQEGLAIATRMLLVQTHRDPSLALVIQDIPVMESLAQVRICSFILYEFVVRDPSFSRCLDLSTWRRIHCIITKERTDVEKWSDVPTGPVISCYVPVSSNFSGLTFIERVTHSKYP